MSIYIAAKMPPMFGRFNRIRKDNYPFSHTFAAYLETVCALGLRLGVDVDALTGYIEDALLGDGRLPDIPEGDEPVVFRFKTENPVIMEYLDGSTFTNKNAVLFIIRTTLRLSAIYGTSLQRLNVLVGNLAPDRAPAQEPEPMSRPEPRPSVRVGKRTGAPAVRAKAPEASFADRLESMTRKADRLLGADREPEPDTPVVGTNPLLSDFL